MGYRCMGRAHALAITLRDGKRGQGTVEYVGLILLIAAVLAAVVTFGNKVNGKDLGEAIVGKLKAAIEGADPKGKPAG